MIEDGWVDCNTGDLESVVKQFFKVPVYLSPEIFSLIEQCNGHEGQSYKGVVHDICFMAIQASKKLREGPELDFGVIFNTPEKKGLVKLYGCIQPWDAMSDPKPVLTIMLPHER